MKNLILSSVGVIGQVEHGTAYIGNKPAGKVVEAQWGQISSHSCYCLGCGKWHDLRIACSKKLER